MGKGILVAGIFLISLFLTSGFISYFQIGFLGTNDIKPLNLPNSLDSYYGAQNYKTGQFNSSINYIEGYGSNWQYVSNVGMVHTSLASILDANYFLIKNVLPSSTNLFINTYKINNTIQKPYKIALRVQGGNLDNNEIIIDEQGFHIPNKGYLGINYGDLSFISYPDASKITKIELITNYYEGGTDNPSLCSITFNGQEFTFSQLHTKGNFFSVGDYLSGIFGSEPFYGGIYSTDIGTVLESFNTNNLIENPANDVNPLSMVSSIIVSMLRLMTYTFPYSIIPLEIQLFLIAPQEFMILLGIALFIREG